MFWKKVAMNWPQKKICYWNKRNDKIRKNSNQENQEIETNHLLRLRRGFGGKPGLQCLDLQWKLLWWMIWFVYVTMANQAAIQICEIHCCCFFFFISGHMYSSYTLSYHQSSYAHVYPNIHIFWYLHIFWSLTCDPHIQTQSLQSPHWSWHGLPVVILYTVVFRLMISKSIFKR